MLLLALGVAACRSVPVAPPPVFPVTTLWRAGLDAAIDPPLGLDEHRVFISTQDGSLRALSRHDGAEVWNAKGVGGALAAGPGTLIVRRPDGRVLSLQPRTGAVRWSAATGVRGSLPPVLDRDVVLVAGTGLAALDTASGRVLWSLPDAPPATSLPVPSGARFVVGEAGGALRCRDRATGAPLWSFATKGDLLAPALVDEQRRVYLGTTDRRLLRIGLDNGRQRWRWKVGADVTAPAATAKDLALFAAYDAVLYAVRRGSGKLAWRAGLPSRPLSGPLLAGNTVLVACQESDLVGFNLKDGRASGSFRLPAEIRTPPQQDGGRLYVGLRDRSVVALALAGLADPGPEAPRQP